LQEHFKCKVLIKMVAEILQLQYFKEDGLRDITNMMIHNWDIETSLQHNWNLLCYQESLSDNWKDQIEWISIIH